MTCQLPDGKRETIILQEVVHLPGSFNLISQSQIMDKDVKVEPVNHYGLNLYNRHGKLIATAPQVEGYSFWIAFWIELRNRPNTPISTTSTAACWHLIRLGMHLGTMQRSGCYGTAAWHTSVSKLSRSC